MDSDYGSDIELTPDDEELLRILDSTPLPPPSAAPPPTANFVNELQNSQGGRDGNNEDDAGGNAAAAVILYPTLPVLSDSSNSVHYDRNETAPQSTTTTLAPSTPPETLQPPGEDPEATSDSPYDRFRARKKALSVTDLVSNIWCEQQYEYTLARGFKRSTPQMERGTQVHKILEEQVHKSVQVDVTTREDRWGLKLFNMYQGMQSLKDQGVTRELPVFGFLGGMFVQGIIDQISYINPHLRVEDDKPVPKRRGRPKTTLVPRPEIAIDLETFSVPGHGKRIAYLSDTKTRQAWSIPSESQARATALQLMLYHRLLSYLYSGNAEFGKLLELFGLDGGANFSDGFIAGIATLEQDVLVDELLECNSLWGMWTLLHKQMGDAIDGIGCEMGVSYRHQVDGSMIGFKTLEYDEAMLNRHLEEVMKWWKGERGTTGVDIEEAWKCRSCEFEAECTWRLGKIEELKKRNQRLTKSR